MIKRQKKYLKEKQQRGIYNKFANDMMSLCFRYLGNLMDAEEALNNGFLKIFRNIDGFVENHENSLKFWIKKIMVNECLMFLRKNNKAIFVDIESVPEVCLPIEYYQKDDYIKIINMLPQGYKMVFNLYAIEGYSNKEIAGLLKITESTSRSQLTKARKMLKELLNKSQIRYA